MHSSIALLAATVGVTVAQQTILINVGNGLFTFAPDSITAEVGDTLEFHFFNSFHTVVQGDFDTPCEMGTKKSNGFNSGPIKNKADGSPDTFQVLVQDTKPIWFYCGTPTHCQSGMNGAVNAPAEGNTLDAYRTAAADTSSSESLPNVQGGCISPLQDSGMGAPNCGKSSSGGEDSSSSEAPSSTAKPESSAPPASSTEESSAAGTTSSLVATTSSKAASSTAALTSSGLPSKSSGAVSTSATIVPAGSGSTVSGNTAVVGVVVAGLGFLVMLA